MSHEKEADVKTYSTYQTLSHHPFASSALHYSVRIKAAIVQRGTVLRAEAKYKRLPSKAEYYCLMVGTDLANVLTICQQLEHSILYFSSFSPTRKMRKAGITRQAHLLYCIENYIVRSQSLYDRLLKLVDAVFEIYNPSRRISHELIVGNSHVRHSRIPNALKVLSKALEPYRRERNVIIHERQFLEDDIRELEAYTILVTSDGPCKGERALMGRVGFLVKQVVKDKMKEFSKVNHDSFVALGEIFNHLNKQYEYKREILERLHGKSELAPFLMKPSDGD